MSIVLKCSGCKATLKLKDTLAGRQVSCPRCGQQISVPAPGQSEAMDTAGDAWMEESDSADHADPFGGDLPDESWDDSYGEELFAPAPRAKKKKSREQPVREQEEKSARGGKWMIAGIFGGMFLVGIVISAVIVGLMDDGGDSEAPGDLDSAVAEVEGGGFTDTEDMVDELGVVMSDMKSLLDSGRNREFLVRYAPLDDLRALKRAEIEKTALPTVPRKRVLAALDQLSGETPKVHGEGWIAEFRVESEVEISEVTPTKGYGSDLNEAIGSAISDLESGHYDQFVEKMIPESAKLHLLNGDTDQTVLAALDDESPLVLMMLADLKELQKLTPEIHNDTAVFRLPPSGAIEGLPAPIRSTRSFQPADREIRFSLIAGSWRFYDNSSDAAVTSGTAVYQLTFERVGRTWRLAQWPG